MRGALTLSDLRSDLWALAVGGPAETAEGDPAVPAAERLGHAERVTRSELSGYLEEVVAWPDVDAFRAVAKVLYLIDTAAERLHADTGVPDLAELVSDHSPFFSALAARSSVTLPAPGDHPEVPEDCTVGEYGAYLHLAVADEDVGGWLEDAVWAAYDRVVRVARDADGVLPTGEVGALVKDLTDYRINVTVSPGRPRPDTVTASDVILRAWISDCCADAEDLATPSFLGYGVCGSCAGPVPPLVTDGLAMRQSGQGWPSRIAELVAVHTHACDARADTINSARIDGLRRQVSVTAAAVSAAVEEVFAQPRAETSTLAGWHQAIGEVRQRAELPPAGDPYGISAELLTLEDATPAMMVVAAGTDARAWFNPRYTGTTLTASVPVPLPAPSWMKQRVVAAGGLAL